MKPLLSISIQQNAGTMNDVVTKKPPSFLGLSVPFVWALLLFPLTPE